MSVRMLLHGMSEIFLPMFFSRTFTVLPLIFMPFIHLEFIFGYGVCWWSSFIFLHIVVQISQHHLLKRLFLLHFMLLPPLSNINWPERLGFISGISILCVSSYSNTRLFWLQWPCNTVDSRYCDLSCLVLLSQNCCSYSGSFMVPYKFLKCLFYICEMCHCYFNRDCIESINRFG